MKILVVRFKQMGDAILATPVCNTFRKTFPDAEIDMIPIKDTYILSTN